MSVSLPFVTLASILLVGALPIQEFDEGVEEYWFPEYLTPTPISLGPPEDLTVTSLDNDMTSASVAISWKPPRGFDKVLGLRAVTDYLLYYCEEGASEWQEVHAPGSMTSLYLAGLHRNTLYHFRIRASTLDGSGPQSDAVFHRTGGEGSGAGSAEPSDTEDTMDNEEGPSYDEYLF